MWMLCQEQNKHMQFALRLRKNPHHLFLLVPGVSRVQSQVLTELLTACWCKHALLTQGKWWTVVFWGKGLKKLLIFSFTKHLLWFLALKTQQWGVGGCCLKRGRFRILDHVTGKKEARNRCNVTIKNKWEWLGKKDSDWEEGALKKRGCRCVNMFMTWVCLSINRQAGQQQERQTVSVAV